MSRRDFSVVILERSHQRNGVSGEPFDVFKIVCSDDNSVELIATMCRENDKWMTSSCRVVNPLELESHFRGDRFGIAIETLLLEQERTLTVENRVRLLENVLRDLVNRVDGDEGVRGDGTNMDTYRAHAALGDFAKTLES